MLTHCSIALRQEKLHSLSTNDCSISQICFHLQRSMLRGVSGQVSPCTAHARIFSQFAIKKSIPLPNFLVCTFVYHTVKNSRLNRWFLHVHDFFFYLNFFEYCLQLVGSSIIQHCWTFFFMYIILFIEYSKNQN